MPREYPVRDASVNFLEARQQGNDATAHTAP
jgi:hypothetical protein